MDDARAMRLVERVADLDRDLQCLVRIESDPFGPATGQAFGQRLAFEILQHEVSRLPSCMSDVEQRADVRMIERRDRARLTLETVAKLRIGGERAARILIATVRSSRVSRARYTSPMPPAPSGATIS